MTTSRAQAVSRVVNELRSLNKDEYYSRRAILQMLEDKATFLLSQKLGDRSIYREQKIFTHLPCFELEKDDAIRCEIAELRRCDILMKSKHKLPEIIASRYGEGILNVTAIDGYSQFDQISARDYAALKNRKYASINNLVYLIKDGYLYIPNQEVLAVNLDILTLRVEDIVNISTCSKEDCCKSYWEYPLINSDKLAESVIREVIQEAVGTFRSIPIDENPNKDSNIKSSTVQ